MWLGMEGWTWQIGAGCGAVWKGGAWQGMTSHGRGAVHGRAGCDGYSKDFQGRRGHDRAGHCRIGTKRGNMGQDKAGWDVAFLFALSSNE